MEFFKKIFISLTVLTITIIVGGIFLYQIAMPHFWEEYPTDSAGDHYVKTVRLKGNIVTKQQELEQAKIAQAERLRNTIPPEKQIYEAKGLQFGADASFAPLFENVIDAARGSGIRIRSITTTDSPGSDPIVTSGLPGYNVSELDIVAVGTYSEFQAFYKNVLREYYLTYFAEIEVKPWELDKSVLISNIKLRLYTKT